MRRKEKAVTDPAAIEAIIDDAQVCRLAMCDQTGPYVVPLCFGYRQGAFYFHSAVEGRKLDILDANPKACVELESEFSLKTGETPCKWGMGFHSVIAFGTVRRITDPRRRRFRALSNTRTRSSASSSISMSLSRISRITPLPCTS